MRSCWGQRQGNGLFIRSPRPFSSSRCRPSPAHGSTSFMMAYLWACLFPQIEMASKQIRGETTISISFNWQNASELPFPRRKILIVTELRAPVSSCHDRCDQAERSFGKSNLIQSNQPHPGRFHAVHSIKDALLCLLDLVLELPALQQGLHCSSSHHAFSHATCIAGINNHSRRALVSLLDLDDNCCR